jgi:hypothetical protein
MKTFSGENLFSVIRANREKYYYCTIVLFKRRKMSRIFALRIFIPDIHVIFYGRDKRDPPFYAAGVEGHARRGRLFEREFRARDI